MMILTVPAAPCINLNLKDRYIRLSYCLCCSVAPEEDRFDDLPTTGQSVSRLVHTDRVLYTATTYSNQAILFVAMVQLVRERIAEKG